MTEQFKTGQHVIYNRNGLCRIVGMEHRSFLPHVKNALYYVLQPVHGEQTKIFLPAESEAMTQKVRPALTKEEIDSILESAGSSTAEWPEGKNERAAWFREVLSTGISVELLRMMRCLYGKRCELQACGKKLSMADEEVWKTAEELVGEEFSYSLLMPRDKVSRYIRTGLGIAEPVEAL